MKGRIRIKCVGESCDVLNSFAHQMHYVKPTFLELY